MERYEKVPVANLELIDEDEDEDEDDDDSESEPPRTTAGKFIKTKRLFFLILI